MKCKFCGAELEENVTVCPACGEVCGDAPETMENVDSPAAGEVPAETAPEVKKKGFPVKAAIAIGCCVVLLFGLAAMVISGMVGGGSAQQESGVLLKESYSVTAEEALASANRVVAAIGDKKLTNGTLQIFYWGQVFDFLSENSYYLSYMGMDYTKPLDEQYYSQEQGLTWQHYFLDSSIAAWNRYQLLCMMAQEDGFVLSEDTQNYLDGLENSLAEMAAAYKVESVDELITGDFSPGCTVEDYRNYLSLYYLGYEYFVQEYEKLNPTDAEVEAYFDQNRETFEEQGITEETGSMVDVRHILIQPEGCTKDEHGYVIATEDQWEACRQEAQAILDGWLTAGGTEDAFAALANQHSVDGGSNTNGGLYTEVMAGDMVENFDAWCFDETRKSGDSGLVQSEFGYHIMYFVGSQEIWHTYAKSTLVSDLMNKRIEEFAADHKMEVDYSKIALGVVDLAG